MTRLSADSLDFSRAHIESFYDSDFFPRPDEYAALWAQWDDVKAHLMSTNVEKLPVNAPRSMAAPKARGGYRVVHQLAPLDAIVYTALAHSVAADVERARSPSSDRTVFSYRIATNANAFFDHGSGYAGFVDRCRELGEAHPFVLAADIADFYNRIYLHRLKNSISLAGPVFPGLASTIEDFLLRLNSKASQGIPVGPSASIIMSEAVLIDIDQFLGTKGHEYARYVDDIRIFGPDRLVLEKLQEELVLHLYESQRLQLAHGKTHVISGAEFIERYLDSPEKHERRELLDVVRTACQYGDSYTDADVEELRESYLKLGEATKVKLGGGARPETWDDLVARLESAAKAQVRAEFLTRVFELAFADERLDLGLLRYALRQARKLGVSTLIDPVLEKYESIGPALPDAFLYLHAVMKDEQYSNAIGKLRRLPSTSLFKRSGFAQHWLYWLLSGSGICARDKVLGNLIWTSAPVEFRARAAARIGNVAFLRGRKAALSSDGMWDRRATLYASRIMPRDERAAWLGSVAARDRVEEWIVSWAKGQP